MPVRIGYPRRLQSHHAPNRLRLFPTRRGLDRRARREATIMTEMQPNRSCLAIILAAGEGTA